MKPTAYLLDSVADQDGDQVQWTDAGPKIPPGRVLTFPDNTTQASAASGGGGDTVVHRAQKTFDNATFKALPSADPYVLVPATETLDYSGAPTTLPWITEVFVVLKTTAGAYTNLGADLQFVLALGSDWSFDLVAVEPNLTDVGVHVLRFPGLTGTATLDAQPLDPHSHPLYWQRLNVNGNIQDNALAFVVSNGLGDLEDGHANNTVSVSIEFRVLDLTTGRFLTTDETGWDEETRTFAA